MLALGIGDEQHHRKGRQTRFMLCVRGWMRCCEGQSSRRTSGFQTSDLAHEQFSVWPAASDECCWDKSAT